MAPRNSSTPSTPSKSNRRSLAERLSGFFSSPFRNSTSENESPNSSRLSSPQKISIGASEQKKKDDIRALANRVMSFDGTTKEKTLTQGVFRLSAEHEIRTKALAGKLNTEEISEMSASNAASLIKAMLLTLNPPLIPIKTQEGLKKLYEEQGPQSASYDAAKFRAKILATLSTIPAEDKDLLESVLNSALHVEANKLLTAMNPTNLGVVFGPNLFKHLEGDDLLASVALQNDLAKAIIEAKIEEKSRATEAAVEEKVAVEKKGPAEARRIEVREAEMQNKMPELSEEDEGLEVDEKQPSLTRTLSGSRASLTTGSADSGVSLGEISSAADISTGPTPPTIRMDALPSAPSSRTAPEKTMFEKATEAVEKWLNGKSKKSFSTLRKNFFEENGKDLLLVKSDGDDPKGVFRDPFEQRLEHAKGEIELSQEKLAKINAMEEFLLAKPKKATTTTESEAKKEILGNLAAYGLLARSVKIDGAPADIDLDEPAPTTFEEATLASDGATAASTFNISESSATDLQDFSDLRAEPPTPSREEIEAAKAEVAAINAADDRVNPAKYSRPIKKVAPPLPERNYTEESLALLKAAQLAETAIASTNPERTFEEIAIEAINKFNEAEDLVEDAAQTDVTKFAETAFGALQDMGNERLETFFNGLSQDQKGGFKFIASQKSEYPLVGKDDLRGKVKELCERNKAVPTAVASDAAEKAPEGAIPNASPQNNASASASAAQEPPARKGILRTIVDGLRNLLPKRSPRQPTAQSLIELVKEANPDFKPVEKGESR